jgi:hypothetical protein
MECKNQKFSESISGTKHTKKIKKSKFANTQKILWNANNNKKLSPIQEPNIPKKRQRKNKRSK